MSAAALHSYYFEVFFLSVVIIIQSDVNVVVSYSISLYSVLILSVAKKKVTIVDVQRIHVKTAPVGSVTVKKPERNKRSATVPVRISENVIIHLN